MNNLRVLITGAGGYIGAETLKVLATEHEFETLVATDISECPEKLKALDGVHYFQADIRDKEKIEKMISDFKINTIIHLAALLPGPDGTRRELEYSVNVDGTKQLLDLCLKHKVEKIIVSSSGAAYGYHADNDAVIKEDHPLRGNKEFPYCEQKTIIENMLADYREKYPELKQVIFRLSATVGANVKNQISDFFEKPVLIGITQTDSPFVFVWDRDVVNCLVKATLETDNVGVFNLSGEGSVPFKKMAKMMNKPFVQLPFGFFYQALNVLYRLKLSQYHPGQASFLRYRPILSNQKLKEEFGYTPQKTSLEAFEFYINNK